MDFDDSLDDIPAVRVKRHLRQRQLQQHSHPINYRESDDNEEESEIDDNDNDNEDDEYTANTSITNRSSSRHRSLRRNSVHLDNNDDAGNKQKSRNDVDKNFVDSLVETNVSQNLETLASTNYDSKNRLRLFSRSSPSPASHDTSTDTTNANEQDIKQEDQGLQSEQKPEQQSAEPEQQSGEPDETINNEGEELPFELDYLDTPEDLENYQRLLTSEYSKLSKDFASSTTQRIDELIGLVDLTINRTKQDYLSFKHRVENSKDNLEHRKTVVDRSKSKPIQLLSKHNNSNNKTKNQSSSNNDTSKHNNLHNDDTISDPYQDNEPLPNPYSTIITPESLAKFRLPHLPQFPIFNSFFQDLMAPKYDH
ncbi:unnamed protein product [Ambrosiozyma monospora]|uniref:Unnamed protein product n=1 Tax=Ambrosiozyma monospora TaxID=43982 RepID=A0ACB5TSP4_AMBMO|nr:unnamed protein product [Ambrosiozyma monospora]